MTITFQEERFVDAWPEFEILAREHWAETMAPVTDDEFTPDTKRYAQFNDIGFYRLYTVRKNGVLMGNLGIYITDSMHTRKIVAQEDSWYMRPEIRTGRTSMRFVQYVEQELIKHGVTSVNTTTPPKAKSRRLLEYMAYSHTANCYHKELRYVLIQPSCPSRA